MIIAIAVSVLELAGGGGGLVGVDVGVDVVVSGEGDGAGAEVGAVMTMVGGSDSTNAPGRDVESDIAGAPTPPAKLSSLISSLGALGLGGMARCGLVGLAAALLNPNGGASDARRDHAGRSFSSLVFFSFFSSLASFPSLTSFSFSLPSSRPCGKATTRGDRNGDEALGGEAGGVGVCEVSAR